MSTSIIALRDMGGKFKEMLEVKEFCDNKSVSYPKEVSDYFGSLSKDSLKTIVLEMLNVPTKEWVSDYHSDSESGFELLVKDIPPEVKTIRFLNSW